MLTELGSDFVETPERMKTIPLHVVHVPPVADWIKNKIGDSTMHVFLRNSGECMLINNLIMQITSFDKSKEAYCVKFEEAGEYVENTLHINAIKADADVVQIADQCFIVCSLIDDDNRASFYLAVKRDIVIRKSPPTNAILDQAN